VLAGYLVRAVAPLIDLVRAVRCRRPDILHANSIRSGLIAVVALRFVRPRPALVVHMRDGPRGSLLDRLVAAVIGRDADAIVAISHFVAQGMTSAAGKVHVVHNAIDRSRYRFNAQNGRALRQQFGVPQDAPLLAVVGQLTPWKGHPDALEAFALLRSSMPHAHLVIAGSAKFVGKHRRYDTLSYRAALIARAEQPDLRGSVHIVDEVRDVAALYSAATLLVVPSWAEPFGRVVIEAMAAGCPVLATRAGGIPEILTHGVDGWLVPPRDPCALAGAMQQLLAAPSLREALARHGLMTVQERFSLSDYTARLAAVWDAAVLSVVRQSQRGQNGPDTP
jgi:glycosyltransferase involved in cell wall biosynthesis